MGFTSTIGIIHDGDGQLKPLGGEERSVWTEMRSWKKKNYSQFNQFQEAIANAQPNDWRCRAGSRYLYICENGLVHYCSQQRGFPGVPLAEYTKADLKARVPDREDLRPALHHQLCASGVSHRPLARSADFYDNTRRGRWTGQYPALTPYLRVRFSFSAFFFCFVFLFAGFFRLPEILLQPVLIVDLPVDQPLLGLSA